MTLGVAMPGALLVLFSSIGKNAPIDIFTVQSLTPGIIVFSFTFLTMSSAMVLAKDRGSAFLTRLYASPLTSLDFVLAYSLPFFPIAFVQIVVCFSVGLLFGLALSPTFLFSLIVLVPIAIACIGTGMILGSLCTENQVAGLGSLFIVAASIFGGAWMDLHVVGGVFELIGYVLPFAHAIDGTRAILSGSGLSSITIHMAWVIGYTGILLGLGVLSFASTRKHGNP